MTFGNWYSTPWGPAIDFRQPQVRSYFIDNAHRTLHGALLDARLLAECYLAMTRGQESLVMELETPAAAAAAAALMQVDLSNLIVVPALPEEVALHEQYLDAMEQERKAPSLWRKLLAA